MRVKMKDQVAKDTVELILDISKKLNDSAKLVCKNTTKEESDKYVKSIAKILFDLYIDILIPIFKEHPEYKPKELK